MNYLDSNFIVVLHFNVAGQTAAAEKFVRKYSGTFLVSSLAELEYRRAFMFCAGHSHSENWLRFQEKLQSGTWVRFGMPWDRAAA